MPNCTIDISGYRNNYAPLNAVTKLKISRYDIAKGMISVGRTHWAQYFTKTSIFGILHYWTGLFPFLKERPNLCVNKAFSSLDSSDKNGKTYVIGTGITHIVASRVLKISCLQYVDELVKLGVIELTQGTKERGDMVGLDIHGNWHVVESKGRTYPPDASSRKKAKTQAERIVSINGKAPATKGYCMTYINLQECRIFLCDPDDRPAKPVSMRINVPDFLRVYYERMFSDFLDRAPDITFVAQGLNFFAFRLDNEEGDGSYIAVESRIYQSLIDGNYLEILEIQQEIYRRTLKLEIDDASLTADGILFFVGTPMELDTATMRHSGNAPDGNEPIGEEREYQVAQEEYLTHG